MENYKGGLKSYWKQYERLDGESGHRRQRRSRIELGGGGERRKKKFWRIKISPRLRFFSRIRRFHPKRILARIRDGYVRMMLSIAGSSVVSGGSGYGFGTYGSSAFGRPVQMKEYDEKMIVQIYKSILAQSQLVAAAEGGGAAGSRLERR